jgi:hypothetical protein
MALQLAVVIGFGVIGAVLPAVVFIAGRAKPVDVVLAAVGYGGFLATLASMGPYYQTGPYLFFALSSLFTAAWVTATVRFVHYRPMQWRWQRKQHGPDTAPRSE